MQVVVTFAKRGDDGREKTRRVIFTVKVKGDTTHWHEAVALAWIEARRDERPVAFAEGGYQ